ncbi:WAT1-related protein [Carex littledalei]|uniref:WAT1-related protein n=1 Tax=Carex littledalei TaxID=544730 RepID=A0A833RQ82_9POAL|nr:WAT1-related protein [Carex littledalei]
MAFSLADYKPSLAMVACQCIFAVMNLLGKAAFNQGFSSLVFAVYRQSIASLAVLPPLFFAKGRGVTGMPLSLKGFCLLFIAALFGGTGNKILQYIGLELGNASLSSVMGNMIPVTTFVMAASVGLEKVELRSLRTWAKIIGTIVCFGGTMILTFYKGPGFLNLSNAYINSVTALYSVSYRWILAVVCLLGSASCWSLWLILQVPISKFIDHLPQTVSLCFLSSLQSATIVFFLEPNLSAWKINTVTELSACLFSGVFGTAVGFYLQSWCVSVRGPVYCAMFMPLNTVITVILATITLHEELHIGSLIGAVAIFGGMYMVLWGKAEDVTGEGNDPTQTVGVSEVTISIDGKEDHGEHSTRRPLLLKTQAKKLDVSNSMFYVAGKVSSDMGCMSV